jgi:hypothetical protein
MLGGKIARYKLRNQLSISESLLTSGKPLILQCERNAWYTPHTRYSNAPNALNVAF